MLKTQRRKPSDRKRRERKPVGSRVRPTKRQAEENRIVEERRQKEETAQRREREKRERIAKAKRDAEVAKKQKEQNLNDAERRFQEGRATVEDLDLLKEETEILIEQMAELHKKKKYDISQLKYMGPTKADQDRINETRREARESESIADRTFNACNNMHDRIVNAWENEGAAHALYLEDIRGDMDSRGGDALRNAERLKDDADDLEKELWRDEEAKLATEKKLKREIYEIEKENPRLEKKLKKIESDLEIALEKQAVEDRLLVLDPKNYAYLLGNEVETGEDKYVGITMKDAREHRYILGKTGYGKTNLMTGWASKDIREARGFGIFSPHEDLIDSILNVIPKSEINRVVYFDPSDLDHPPALNFFNSDLDPEIVASGFRSAIETLYPGQITTPQSNILHYSVMTVLTSVEKPSIVELKQILLDEDYRKSILQKITDQEIKDWWRLEFSKRSNRDTIAAFVDKLNIFLRNRIIRNVFGQPENKFDFVEIMENKKIFIANLKKLDAESEPTYVHGTFLLNAFLGAAFKRGLVDEGQGREFALYIDEFQNFVSRRLETILEETRKYGLNLTLAHQKLMDSHLDTALKGTLRTSPQTKVIFQVEGNDANFFGGSSFGGGFKPEDFANLPRFHALVKVGAKKAKIETVKAPGRIEQAAILAQNKAKIITTNPNPKIRKLTTIKGRRKNIEKEIAKNPKILEEIFASPEEIKKESNAKYTWSSKCPTGKNIPPDTTARPADTKKAESEGRDDFSADLPMF